MGKESIFTLIMEATTFVDTLEQLQHITRLFLKGKGTHKTEIANM
jgi:hypothetical protein